MFSRFFCYFLRSILCLSGAREGASLDNREETRQLFHHSNTIRIHHGWPSEGPTIPPIIVISVLQICNIELYAALSIFFKYILGRCTCRNFSLKTGPDLGRATRRDGPVLSNSRLTTSSNKFGCRGVCLSCTATSLGVCLAYLWCGYAVPAARWGAGNKKYCHNVAISCIGIQ